MAYDEHLADRIRRILKERKSPYRELNMMGGWCAMVDEKMCIGIVKEHLMARVGPDAYEEALKRPGAKPMDFTGRPMKGYVFVNEDGFDQDSDLERWIDLCLAFNPHAKSSKKR